ncbi:hypothetical protein [Peribacillus simplex]|uniref:hypothetical protein n=1 Tax=Peribacillus simplex TaxID=1478 RepID=UPI0036DAA734
MEPSLNKLQSDYFAGNGKVIQVGHSLYRRRSKQERKEIGLSLQEKELRSMRKIPDCLDKETVPNKQNKATGDFIGYFDQ